MITYDSYIISIFYRISYRNYRYLIMLYKHLCGTNIFDYSWTVVFLSI